MSPHCPEAKADCLIDQGDLSGAERILNELLTNDPNSLGALTRVYIRMRQYPQALRHGRRTLQLNPDEPNASLNLGIVYDLMGNSRRAIHYYRRELAADPYSPETLWNLGCLYFAKHRWKSAADCLQRCFDVGFWKHAETTVYNLGQCYYKLRNVEGYIRVYEKYLNVYPNSAWAAANLGGALLHAGQYRRAAIWLRKAFHLNPSGSVAEKLLFARQELARNRSLGRSKAKAE